MNERPSSIPESRLRAALARAGRAGRPGDPESAERLCEETAARLFDHLDPIRIDPRWAVDLAMQCGLHDRLEERYPSARVVSCGYSPGARVPGRASGPRTRCAIAAKPARLPIKDGAADLVVSNLALCWFPDLVPILREIRRVLRPGGLVAFVTLGPATLAELGTSWEEVDDWTHIIDFIDMHDVGDAMVRAGFSDVVMDAERVTVTWPDLPSFLRDLRGLGTGNPSPDRSPGLTTPRALASLHDVYERRRSEGRVPATVELVHGHGWNPESRAEVRFEGLPPG